ncbi:alpha-2-macroglobulin family protein [Halanaerobacter jeridensis]|uniref:Uncharacterized protein YfaS (Alpha-2-macroglobulin family) n=1 Tax=Halanaerobacter jeridensis TaxID=706427 RepID=A0A938XT96_9FIRM|nr:MG2 domain-containing protein [Halanaerobacter jeridensis]MBM7556474.1 uncharacterized protein YfaS (alpha-2-macroglobulin family) [Halanaerobacter jeridensis]
MFSSLRQVISDNFGLIIALLLLIGLIAFLIGRNVEPKDLSEEMITNDSSSKTITRVTSGVVEADGRIAVEFAEAQIDEDYIDYPLEKEEIFNFTPELEGQVYWRDTKTIVFKPQHKLTGAKNYTGLIDLAKVFPNLQEVKPDKKSIQFRTLGQRLLSWQGEFELVDGGQKQARFKAEFELAEEASRKAVREAVKLSGPQQIEWAVETKDNHKFKLVSDKVARTEEDMKFKLLIDKERLNLAQQVKKEYLLPAVGPLRVVDVEEQKVDDHSNLRLLFSDYLAQNLNYKAYLNVKPDLNYDVQVEGRGLTLKGDFKPDQKYRVQLFKGLKGKLGSQLKTTKNVDFTVEISDIEPKLRFAQSGIYLTTLKEQKIAFQTMNVQRVTAKVKKINADDVVEFLERNSYRPQGRSFNEYEERSFQWAGEVIDVKTLDVGQSKNKWITSQLDLAAAIEKSQPGLYIVQLEFDEDDTLYMPPEWDDYDCQRHIRNHGQKAKHLILSNLGVTVKRSAGKTHVFVNDILTTEPVKNAVVELKNDYDDHSGGHEADNDEDDGDRGDDDGDNYDDYDHPAEVVDTAMTNQQGMAVLEGSADYIEVKKGQQLSVLEFDATKLDTSLFDTGGVNNEQGLKTFLYTDRGVYRPGDKVHLAAIVRNESNTFPADHPVTVKVYNPKKKLVYEETNRQAEDGFYTFDFSTKDTALTGSWELEAEVGSQSFFKELKVESVVPYRIEVKINPEQEKLTLDDEIVDFSLSSKYLFGAPAKGLDSKTEISIEPYAVDFAKFNSFVFTNQGQHWEAIKSKKFEQQLDQQGKTNISWELPQITDVPSGLRVKIDTKVLEKGGRPVPAQEQIPVKTYDRFVGIKKLKDDGLAIGSKVNFNLALVDKDGELISGEKLKYKIYRMRRYWWWEYDDRDSFRKHFKKDKYIEVVKQGTITSRQDLATLKYQLEDYGEMFLEVTDVEGGHQAGYFFRSYWWGDEGNKQSADVVTLKPDKDQYYPGETAKIAVNTPQTGRALLAVEKNGRILQKEWKEITSNQTVFEVGITKEHIPNAYVFISVLQPQENNNDLPIRMYGIESLAVTKKNARLNYQLQVPEKVQPKEEFRVKVNTEEKEQSQFTIAVVDEGLLNITNFKTPDPLDHFFKKERLITQTFDNLADIIGLDSGYIYNVFSIGGAETRKMSKDYQEKQLQAEETNRFEPVAMFKGPIKTDEQGQAEVDFKMPNYIGSVRVMVVGAEQGSYGAAEKNIPVKSDLMLMPTLPRVLGPKDEIKVPVTVFGMAEDLANVEVSLEVEGPIEVVGAEEKNLAFNGAENKDINFNLKAVDGIGEAKITFKAQAQENNYQSQKTINLAVRPYNPYIYKGTKEVIASGEQVTLPVPKKGIANSNYAQVSLSRRRSLNLQHRLKWLIRYPYGCIEQTTSSIFPQLYLEEISKLEQERIKEIDKNINSGIQRLRKFQLDNGGFSYWPNSHRASLWGTNYAGHFLLAAQEQGYAVPQDMFAAWLDYQQEQSRDKEGHRLTRAYRLYLLALADEGIVSEMNYMRENELGQMRTPTKYFLAGAYQVLGYDEVAQELIDDLGFDVQEYRETGGTYGSRLRDKAVILDILTQFAKYDQALAVYNDIAEELSTDDWYSTQSTAYSLLAASQYLKATGDSQEELAAEVITAQGEEKEATITDKIAAVPVNDSFGGEVTVKNKSQQPLFATLEWEGIPHRDEIKAEENNMALQVEWLNKAGKKIDPTKLEQGTTFWGHFTVDKTVDKELSEVALVQILPAGWEIENIRLSNEKLPAWMDDYDLDNEEYLDIRDDRVRWFFDMDKYQDDLEFVVKINTVTVGEFYLPPTLVEAMYDNRYKATTAGQRVEVLSR